MNQSKQNRKRTYNLTAAHCVFSEEWGKMKKFKISRYQMEKKSKTVMEQFPFFHDNGEIFWCLVRNFF